MAKKKNKSKKVATKKNKSTLTKEQIKKFNKLQDEADDNTESGGYYIDEFKYCYGNLAQDLCDAGDKEWARRIYKITRIFCFLINLSRPLLVTKIISYISSK